jgi:SPP1 family predicted phage head-tail adaptor
MRIGAHRHLVHLERPAHTARDAAGHPVPGWEAAGEAYASIEPLSGRDLEIARQSAARVTHRVTLRYRDGLDSRCRVIHRDRTLNVRSILRVEEGSRELALLCEEAV